MLSPLAKGIFPNILFCKRTRSLAVVVYFILALFAHLWSPESGYKINRAVDKKCIVGPQECMARLDDLSCTNKETTFEKPAR